MRTHPGDSALGSTSRDEGDGAPGSARSDSASKGDDSHTIAVPDGGPEALRLDPQVEEEALGHPHGDHPQEGGSSAEPAA